MVDHDKTVCLLIGPESTGTRLFASILSEHPKVLGTPEATTHLDILDPVWQALEQNRVSEAIRIFPDYTDKQCIITRRSLPHAVGPGQPARYMHFVDLCRFNRLCKRMQLGLVLLVTSRSPIPNLYSWKNNRLSAGRSYERAQAQYYASYCHVFDFIRKHRVQYYIVGLEALIVDGQNYVQSLFQLLGLSEYKVGLALNTDINLKYYGLHARGDTRRHL
jgi:hypothetical protein